MTANRITSNLPSRKFADTIAFYARLGFAVDYQSDDWLILSRGTMELEFFPHPGLDPRDSWFSACIRVDDLDALWRDWHALGLPSDPHAVPRITSMMLLPHTPRMFALVDPDGSLLRCLDNEEA